MAFVTLDPLDLQVGKPITRDLFLQIKDNEDCLFDDVQALIAATIIRVFDYPVLFGGTASTLTALTLYKVTNPMVIDFAEIYAFETGPGSGPLRVDVKKNTSSNPVGFTSIFTTQPAIDYGAAGNYQGSNAGPGSTPAVIDPVIGTCAVGDVLRLDATAIPSGPTGKFEVLVTGQPI